jgi:hypothetical protein
MRSQVVRQAALSALVASAITLCVPTTADAAAPLGQTIVITPAIGCGLLTAYTAGTGLSASSGPAPSCGIGPFLLAFNQGNTPPPALGHGVGTAGSALLAWSSTSVPNGARMGYQITAPAGITINKVVYDVAQLQNIANGRGWIGLTYWNGGTAQVRPDGTAVDAAASGASLDTNLNTSYWGIELRCVQSLCTWPGKIQLNQFQVSASETQEPSITPVTDAASLWNQNGWVWNAAGNPWTLPMAANDPGGICSLSVQPGGSPAVADPSLPGPDDSSWQECQPATWTATVDTHEYVSGAGQLPITLQATNAAGLPNAPMSETLNVDNQPVSVSLSTPDDPNPTLWVNHAVTVDATPSTGPSGLGGMSCGVNGGVAQTYPAGGLPVDGDGVKTVSCTAWNNAVDPQGNHNSATSSVTVHIDEAPPALSLEPVNPNDPTGLVADTSDSESGVAGGSIDMAPAGSSSWTALPTTFTGTQLVAHFDDAGLIGPYTFRIQSCDNVGNCASTSRTLALPARAQAVSEVSLVRLPTTRCASASVARNAAEAPAPSRVQRVSAAMQAGEAGLTFSRVGEAPRHRAAVVALPVANGGTLAGDDLVSLMRSLSHRRPQAHVARATAHRHRELRRSCSRSTASLTAGADVAFGRSVRVQGFLMSSAGLPLAGQPVAVMTAPDNGSDAFTEAAAVTTGPDGRWTATLPPGPSRIIEASYAGSPTVLPATGSATVITPANIELTRVTPDRTPWGSTVRITGRVLGGYIPTSSKLLRLDLGVVGIPGLSKIQGIPNVSPDGRFTTTYTFAHAYGVVRFWLMVSSLREADFPFAPAHSRRVVVTVGVPRPVVVPSPRRRHHRHRGRAGHHRHHKRR